MLRGFGTTELLIVAGIVILLFGVGRIGKIAGELGSGIKAFKKGMDGDDKDKEQPKSDTPDATQDKTEN